MEPSVEVVKAILINRGCDYIDCPGCCGSAFTCRFRNAALFCPTRAKFDGTASRKMAAYIAEKCLRGPKGNQESKAVEWKVGDRVKRGPDWKWGNQGGGTEGAVIEVRRGANVLVRVKWDNGETFYYLGDTRGIRDIVPVPTMVMVDKAADKVEFETILGLPTHEMRKGRRKSLINEMSLD